MNQQDEDDNSELVRTKTVYAETMSLEEAIMKMELLSHSFFIYRDSDNDSLALVYKRFQGGYGLLEIES